MNINILHFDSIDSTNSEAIKQARAGAAEGLCIQAARQTAGRGRHGRKWISELDSGLYFSIVLRPDIEMRFLPLITLMAGVAAFDTLADLGLEPDIKWVNDLLVNEKKIGGILAEAIETSAGLAVIVGIGLNLTSGNIRDEMAAAATSIEAETGKRVAADDAAKVLTAHLARVYDVLKGGSYSGIIDRWRRRSTYYNGKAVRVDLGDSAIEGVTDGLEENGALRVRTADGSLSVVQAGDVQRLRQLNFG